MCTTYIYFYLINFIMDAYSALHILCTQWRTSHSYLGKQYLRFQKQIVLRFYLVLRFCTCNASKHLPVAPPECLEGPELAGSEPTGQHWAPSQISSENLEYL